MNRLKEKEQVQEEINETEVTENVDENEDVNEVTESCDEYKEKLARTLAEFDNYKKRTQKEKESIYSYAICETVEKILPVYDSLKLSLSHECTDEALKKGVEVTIKQFDNVLNSLGVSEIEALGKTFDPNVHNAVMHIDDDSYGEKEIVEVLQVGYQTKDKVIRYSMVKVAN